MSKYEGKYEVTSNKRYGSYTRELIWDDDQRCYLIYDIRGVLYGATLGLDDMVKRVDGSYIKKIVRPHSVEFEVWTPVKY